MDESGVSRALKGLLRQRVLVCHQSAKGRQRAVYGPELDVAKWACENSKPSGESLGCVSEHGTPCKSASAPPPNPQPNDSEKCPANADSNVICFESQKRAKENVLKKTIKKKTLRRESFFLWDQNDDLDRGEYAASLATWTAHHGPHLQSRIGLPLSQAQLKRIHDLTTGPPPPGAHATAWPGWAMSMFLDAVDDVKRSVRERGGIGSLLGCAIPRAQIAITSLYEKSRSDHQQARQQRRQEAQ